MEMIICLTKEDVETSMAGEHYLIKTPNGVSINFTPDALEEFLNDVAEIKAFNEAHFSE